MAARRFSRREFTRAVGAGLGATLVATRLGEEFASGARLPADAPADSIQLNANENPYGPSKKALEAMTRSQGVAARYPDAAEAELVEVIAKLHGVEPANVTLGCGSGEILRLAAMAFLTRGKTVVVAEPTFEAVLGYARVPAADPVKVPLTADFRHDLPAMAKACDTRTGLVYICNPNNPTATIVTRSELERLLAQAPKTATVLVDEAYHHFVEDPRYSSSTEWIGKVPNLVVCRTFSKVYGMAGMRLGYAVGTKKNIARMREHVIWNNSNASVLAAAKASLEDIEHVPRHREQNNSTRRWLCEEFERDGRRYIPSETNFVMVDVGGDVSAVIPKFRERKLLVGRKFPSLANWLRISIGTKKEMESFLTALREIVPSRTARAA